VLPNDVTVAVKKLHLNGQVFDDTGFYAEVNSMKKLSNKNVVRLLGYCLHTETEEQMYNGERVLVETRRERLLCFEYVPNGPVQKAGMNDPQCIFGRSVSLDISLNTMPTIFLRFSS
jgi:serine/threonine protein kinase